jgi:hypothetical protein
MVPPLTISDQLHLSDTTQDLLRRAMFVEPLPEVTRMVFLWTPHRGSFVAGRNIIANVVRRLLTLPFALTGVAADIARNPAAWASGMSPVLRTAVDNMSPHPHFIRTLAEIPVAPSITVNSISAGVTDGPVEQGNDGAVEYSSAHIEPVESELVVKSGHSRQGIPTPSRRSGEFSGCTRA